MIFRLTRPELNLKKNERLPLVRWQRNNNATHGVLKAYVDLKTGRKPSDVKVYYARTLDKKRRDFRLVIGDPNDPSKAIPHPVVWLTDSKVLTVKEETNRITYEAAFLIPTTHWLGFFIQFSFPGLENSVLQITTGSYLIAQQLYATIRKAFGKLIIEHDLHCHTLGNMEVECRVWLLTLFFGAKLLGIEHKGYSVADYAGNIEDRKSTSGYVLKYKNCPVSWNCSKQKVVSLSSTESEYIALTLAVIEGLWLNQLFKELNLSPGKVKIFCDNKSTICLTKNPDSIQDQNTLILDIILLEKKLMKDF
ncbi:unnamed protein product [Brachionus calyciflorus]|uniref:Uncharacterized protein n=1 Tax=Brachionus calyciflorus TaxID=104777 RepID=A0A814ARP7_9BILA|nr:unnamed protein product [Brachionus calyciflorus]